MFHIVLVVIYGIAFSTIIGCDLLELGDPIDRITKGRLNRD